MTENQVYRHFHNDLEGVFHSRPNRFVVEVKVKGRILRAHCPNPGRMREIFVPERRLILQKTENTGGSTSHRLVAAIMDDVVVPLYSAGANEAVSRLLFPKIFPKGRVQREVRAGESRLDFLIHNGEQRHWIEVKACTLVKEGLALFPDAPSQRASRHLHEMRGLPKGDKKVVVIAVMDPRAKAFSPNPHTDPELVRNFNQISDIEKIVVSFRTGRDGMMQLERQGLPLIEGALPLVLQDRGVLLELAWNGGKETYLAVSYHQRDLSKVLRRSMTGLKSPISRWQGDRTMAQEKASLLIRCSQDQEQKIRESLKNWPISYHEQPREIHAVPGNALQEDFFWNWLFYHRHKTAFEASRLHEDTTGVIGTMQKW